MTHLDLRDIVEVHANDLRALLYLIKQETFAPAFEHNPHRVYSLVRVIATDPIAQKRYEAMLSLKRVVKRNIDSLAELRARAGQLGVQKYSRLSKEELLEVVEKYERTYAADRGTGSNGESHINQDRLEAGEDCIQKGETRSRNGQRAGAD